MEFHFVKLQNDFWYFLTNRSNLHKPIYNSSYIIGNQTGNYISFSEREQTKQRSYFTKYPDQYHGKYMIFYAFCYRVAHIAGFDYMRFCVVIFTACLVLYLLVFTLRLAWL